MPNLCGHVYFLTPNAPEYHRKMMCLVIERIKDETIANDVILLESLQAQKKSEHAMQSSVFKL